jgi:hypothetical protein
VESASKSFFGPDSPGQNTLAQDRIRAGSERHWSIMISRFLGRLDLRIGFGFPSALFPKVIQLWRLLPFSLSQCRCCLVLFKKSLVLCNQGTCLDILKLVHSSSWKVGGCGLAITIVESMVVIPRYHVFFLFRLAVLSFFSSNVFELKLPLPCSLWLVSRCFL